jgi:N-acetylmuramoyl-L-alanine amidase
VKRGWTIKRVAGATGAIGAGAALALALSGAALAGSGERFIPAAPNSSVTLTLPSPAQHVRIIDAAAPGRPLVLIDPGHGGHDPGALSASGEVAEKALTLQLALELRDQLAKNGRVRIAMTREDDRFLSLDQRAALARRLGASLYLSLHMDSAPNPNARGASVYSLSDIASDAEAARHARRENGDIAGTGGSDGSVRAILSDLALRSQMAASANLATRVVRHSAGRIELRPQPHRFADFQVLRSAGVPAILFEAGYISNADDEAMLRSPERRSPIVQALALSIEADIAARSIR